MARQIKDKVKQRNILLILLCHQVSTGQLQGAGRPKVTLPKGEPIAPASGGSCC